MQKIMPLVNAPCGSISGTFEEKQAVFSGIPFACPPVADLRWQPPRALPDFEGVFAANKCGNSCIQPASTWMYIDPATMSEDCLYLNVRTPSDCGKVPLPVAVHIHGGGYTIGTGSWNFENGKNFTDKDIVFVTINYRLGPYGFLYLDAIDQNCQGSGSIGVLDQIAALKWVQRNIAAFGGDPDNVTIMGCSAGGGSVSALMASPLAKGLFHKAIAQSGSLRLTKQPEKADAVARTVMNYCGVSTVDEMRALTPQTVEQAYRSTLKKYGFTSKETAFAPVRDGIVVPEEPHIAIEHGCAAGVKLLTGTTRDEMLGFKHISWLTRFVNFTLFKLLIPKDVGEYFGRMDDKVADFYKSRFGTLSAADKFYKAATAGVFMMPQLHMAIAQARHATVYFYRFDWGWSGEAWHGSESPYVFGRYNAELKVDGQKRNPPEKVVLAMHNAWAEFIRTGSPATGDTTSWETFNDQNYPTMLIKEECELQYDPNHEERVFWQELDM